MFLDCCDTYEIRGNGHHPFARNINKLYGTYKRMPELYYGHTPIWKLTSEEDIFLYKQNDGIQNKVFNYGRGYWNIGRIEGGLQHLPIAYCHGFAGAFDWCPHRVKYCHPEQWQYSAEDMMSGIRSQIM